MEKKLLWSLVLRELDTVMPTSKMKQEGLQCEVVVMLGRQLDPRSSCPVTGFG